MIHERKTNTYWQRTSLFKWVIQGYSGPVATGRISSDGNMVSKNCNNQEKRQVFLPKINRISGKELNKREVCVYQEHGLAVIG